MRGDGFTYKRGARWWIGYNRDGTFHREPCGKDVTNKTDAKAVLRQVHRAINLGTFLAPIQRQTTIDDVLDELLVHLRNKGAASVRKVESHLKAVRAAFGHVRAVDLDTATVERYQRARLDVGRAPATVNRKCEALRQALRRAARVTPQRIATAPHVPLLTVRNARQGFLSRADFEALHARLTDPAVRDFVEWFW